MSRTQNTHRPGCACGRLRHLAAAEVATAGRRTLAVYTLMYGCLAGIVRFTLMRCSRLLRLP